MFALAWFDAAMSQRAELEKSSVMSDLPRPGRISGVGALVDSAISVGVTDGGNQIMVAVGGGVSVAVTGIGVASIASSWAQEVRSNIKMRAIYVRLKKLPRNVVKVENIIFIL